MWELREQLEVVLFFCMVQEIKFRSVGLAATTFYLLNPIIGSMLSQLYRKPDCSEARWPAVQRFQDYQ